MTQHPSDSELLAVDALQPLLDRLRAQIAPSPTRQPATATPAPPADDALTRATRLARQSLQEARRFAIGERRITSEQRKAWQEAARRYPRAHVGGCVTGRGGSRRVGVSSAAR